MNEGVEGGYFWHRGGVIVYHATKQQSSDVEERCCMYICTTALIRAREGEMFSTIESGNLKKKTNGVNAMKY